MKPWKKIIGVCLSAALISSTLPLYGSVHAVADSGAQVQNQALEPASIQQDEQNQTVTIRNDQLQMTLNYDHRLLISSMLLNGEVEVIEPLEVSGTGIASNSPIEVNVAASHSFNVSPDGIERLNDGIISYSNNPRNRWTSYRSNATGSKWISSDWVEYNFGKKVAMNAVQLHFFSDGGGVKAPQSYQIQYWNDNEWVDVNNTAATPAVPAGNEMNAVTFDAVSASKLRVVLKHQKDAYSGLTEMQVLLNNKVLSNKKNTAEPEWNGSDQLAESPDVQISGNQVVFSDITYSVDDAVIHETWTFTVKADDIVLGIERSYDGDLIMTNQRSMSLAFKETAFDVVQRTEDGGSFILLNPDHEVDNRFLSGVRLGSAMNRDRYDNTKYSFYTTDMDFIDKQHQKMLSISVASNRNTATKLWRPTSGSRSFIVEYKMIKDDFSLTTCTYLPLYVFTNEDFNPVEAAAGQTDRVEYSFKATDHIDKYYDLGYIPESAGLDEYVLAQYMQDFGRSNVIDKHVGMADTDVNGMGTYETWWYSVNALGTQGAGNSGNLETLKNFVRFVKDTNFSIYNNGQLYSRTYDKVGWIHDFFLDSYGQFIAGIANIYRLTGDEDWLLENKDMTRTILSWVMDEARDLNHNGMIEDFANYQISGNEWNDSAYISQLGMENAYANIMIYKALTDWAEIEEKVFGDENRANQYRSRAALIKETLNKNVTEGGFWSPETKSFVYWRDRNGNPQDDISHIFTNAYPIIFDMVDEQRAKEILHEYTVFMEKNNLSLFPTQRKPWKAVRDPWQNHINGGIFLQMTYDMMGAYAKIGDAEKPLQMLKRAVQEYAVDGMWNGSWYRWDMNGIVEHEAWMSSNVRPASGFYNFIVGIKPQIDRLVLDPSLDESMNGTSVQYTWRDQTLRFTLHDQNKREIHMEQPVPVESVWSHLEDQQAYKIVYRNVTSGEEETHYVMSRDKTVRYTVNTVGTHYVSLEPAEMDLYVPRFEEIKLENALPDQIMSNLALPVEGANGEQLTWLSSDPSVISDGGIVTRPSLGEKNKQVKLTAIISLNGESYKTVLDLVVLAEQNNEAWITSTVYSVNDAAQTIRQVQENTSVQSLLKALNSAKGATVRLVGEDGLTEVTGGYVASSMKLVVLAADQITKREYTVFVHPGNIVFNPMPLSENGGGFPKASASHEFMHWSNPTAWKTVDGIQSYSDSPHNRWHNYRNTLPNSPGMDWLQYDFAEAKNVNEIQLYMFKNSGADALPTNVTFKYWDGIEWKQIDQVELVEEAYQIGKNTFRFEPVKTSRIRIEMGYAAGTVIAITETEVYGLNKDTTIASMHYLIDRNNGVVTLPEEAVDKSILLSHMELADGAVLEVYQADGTTVLDNGFIAAGMRLRITAEDGATIKEYVVHTVNSNANLDQLEMSVGTLQPEFEPDVTEYAMSVPYSNDSIRLKAQTLHNLAGMKVNGKPLENGQWSEAVSLPVGKSELRIEVVAEDGTIKSYAITITRAGDTTEPEIPTVVVDPPFVVEPGSPTAKWNAKVNGVDQPIGVFQIDPANNQSVTLTIHSDLLKQALKQQLPNTRVGIAADQASRITLKLNDQALNHLIEHQAIVEIQTSQAQRVISNQELQAIAKQLGKTKEFSLQVETTIAEQAIAQALARAAVQSDFTVLQQPLRIAMTVWHDGKELQWSKVNAYKELILSLPKGWTNGQTATAVTLGMNGKVKPLPTLIMQAADGSYYAVVKSMDADIISLVREEASFKDISSHWAKDAIQALGDRLIVNGVKDNQYEPDRFITRAEFTAIITRALGLESNQTRESLYNDVASSAWYSDSIQAAAANKLIRGF